MKEQWKLLLLLVLVLVGVVLWSVSRISEPGYRHKLANNCSYKTGSLRGSWDLDVVIAGLRQGLTRVDITPAPSWGARIGTALYQTLFEPEGGRPPSRGTWIEIRQDLIHVDITPPGQSEPLEVQSQWYGKFESAGDPYIYQTFSFPRGHVWRPGAYTLTVINRGQVVRQPLYLNNEAEWTIYVHCK